MKNQNENLNGLVTAGNLSNQFNKVEGKVELSLDNNTLVFDTEAEVIKVDASKLGITVVSSDDNNVVTLGTDKGAFVSPNAIKALVGEMVASATDGIDYDKVTETLKAYVTSLAVTDSNTVDLTQTTTDDGSIAIKADVIIDPAEDNTIVVGQKGLKVTTPATTNSLTKTGVKLTSNVNGVTSTLDLVGLIDINGSTIAYALV